MEGLLFDFKIENSCSISLEMISEVSTRLDLMRTRDISSVSDLISLS